MKHLSTPALAFLDEALERERLQGLLRERPALAPPQGLSFCSNDYLDLAGEVGPPAASGAGASRLLGGDRPIHAELEDAAAALVGLPSALVFSSGYAANVGLLSAVAGPGDLVLSDRLNHASIIDGARLSRAHVEVVPHLDVDAVRRALGRRSEARAFVVTESYFSMDADTPDLSALRQVCDESGAALLVDEAHALGVLGPAGRGLCLAAGVVPDAVVGTFGKAFGAGGAFVAGCPALIRWLWTRARSFVFSTGVSPILAAAALAGLQRAAAQTERRTRVLAAADQLRAGLRELGLPLLGYGPIVPWVLGDAREALAAASDLRARGVSVLAVRPPTVPVGTARLRLTITAAHSPAGVEEALRAIREAREGARG